MSNFCTSIDTTQEASDCGICAFLLKRRRGCLLSEWCIAYVSLSHIVNPSVGRAALFSVDSCRVKT
uniref:Uncharacterized protein n=1 Tax=Hyaloperonospora arabidopsidis (strain Emoy2) TaxID=559515 RepID=M4BZK7_HYAAE